MNDAITDTIVAPATAPGRASVGIVRLSGPLVRTLAKILLGKLPPPRKALYTHFKNIDKGIALFFPAPHSFTGEDVLELQGHGGQSVMNLLIEETLQHGVRLAEPGEFSKRAFLNNKIDLAQAEAIADLIDAGSKQAALAAMRSLEGVFSAKINKLIEKIIRLRIYLESSIDFTEEEIDFLSHEQIVLTLKKIIKAIKNIIIRAKQGVLLHEGMTIAIAGKPNAGKSSLLNYLTGRDSAIVTAIPGTTRDILREPIHIDGLPIQIIDTAGLRESEDIVEQEGIRRARDAIQKADCVLYLHDITQNDFSSLPIDHPNIINVYNKKDLAPEKIKNNMLAISAKTGDGINALKQHLKNIMGFHVPTETGFTARRRHLDSLKKTQEVLSQAQLTTLPELIAEDLRLAQQHLSEITGEFTTEDLLGKIFSTFCVGK